MFFQSQAPFSAEVSGVALLLRQVRRAQPRLPSRALLPRPGCFVHLKHNMVNMTNFSSRSFVLSIWNTNFSSRSTDRCHQTIPRKQRRRRRKQKVRRRWLNCFFLKQLQPKPRQNLVQTSERSAPPHDLWSLISSKRRSFEPKHFRALFSIGLSVSFRRSKY